MTPYRIKSQSVRVRRRRGPEFELVSLLKHLSFSQRGCSSNPAARLLVERAGSRPPISGGVAFLFAFIQSFQGQQCAQISRPPRYQKSLRPFRILPRAFSAAVCPALSYRSRNPQDGISCLTRSPDPPQRRRPLRSLI